MKRRRSSAGSFDGAEKPTLKPFGCLVLVLLVVGSCSVPYVLHNRALARVRGEYPRISHPASSSVLASFSDVGLLGGNGNHCDYLVGEIRESDDSPEQLKAVYSAFSFPMLDPNTSQWGGEPVPVTIEFPETARDSSILQFVIPEVVKNARAQQRKKTLYAVYILDGGYEPNGDLRCH